MARSSITSIGWKNAKAYFEAPSFKMRSGASSKDMLKNKLSLAHKGKLYSSKQGNKRYIQGWKSYAKSWVRGSR